MVELIVSEHVHNNFFVIIREGLDFTIQCYHHTLNYAFSHIHDRHIPSK